MFCFLLFIYKYLPLDKEISVECEPDKSLVFNIATSRMASSVSNFVPLLS